MDPKTPEQIQKNIKDEQDTCDHIGTHGPVAQNLVVNPVEILVIVSSNCSNCGKQFTDISPITLMPPDAKDNSEIIAQKAPKGGIFKPGQN